MLERAPLARQVACAECGGPALCFRDARAAQCDACASRRRLRLHGEAERLLETLREIAENYSSGDDMRAYADWAANRARAAVQAVEVPEASK